MSLHDTLVLKQYSPKYSLAHLTLLGCSVPELTYIAARAGYDAISPRLIPMGVKGEFPFSPHDKEMLRATRNALKVTGIQVHDIELARIADNVDVRSYEPAMEIGAELGADKLIASAWTTSRNNRNLVIDTYGQICDLADNYGLSVALEFPSFSRLSNLAEAADIVRAVDRPNAEILIDTLYMHMSRVSPDELEGLPSNWFSFIHICDVLPGIPDSTSGMIQIARDSRLYPGEGCVDFTSIIERLPPVNYSIELPNRSRVAELGYEEHARRCLQTAKRKFGSVRSKQITGARSALVHNQSNEESYGSRTHI